MKLLNQLFSLEEKRILITGAAGGIGRKVAETYAELGAVVLLCDRDSQSLEEVSEHLKQYWPACMVECYECDLECENSRLSLFERVCSTDQSLHAIVHCAGFVGTTNLSGWVDDFEKQSLDTWRRAFEVNLTSAFHLSQLFSKPLTRSNGSIILFSSIYGELGPDYSLYENTSMGNPAAYAASKGGLIQLARWLATTMAPNVRVNCVSPGGVFRNQAESFVEKYECKTPLQRMAVEDDFKGIVALLASDAGSYITGQNIMVDGGWSIW